MRKVIIKTCALIMTVSMLFGMIFMSDSATTYSMAATKTVETPESSKNALTKYKKIQGQVPYIFPFKTVP
mgnify:CR=1 FL=1